MTQPAYGPAEVPRDRWGRPMVIPPEGGAPTPYTRCTTFVGCLEDTYNLSKWQQRMVAIGLSTRQDLLLRANSLGPQPEDSDEIAVRRWKTAIGEVCEAAMEAAQSSASATIGTALHALTERIDRGEDVGPVPSQYLPHLKAYEQATRTFSALHIERFTVHDQLRIGGTPDRVLAIDGLPGAYIGDVKTGTTEYGVGKMAMQLAVYSRSVLYDPATGQRHPYATEVNTDRGLIIALNAKTGVCDLIWVDLAAGWEAVQLAQQVRAWRARKNLKKPFGEEMQQPLPVQDPDAATRAALNTAIDNASTTEELLDLWRAAHAFWTDDHTARATARKATLMGVSA